MKALAALFFSGGLVSLGHGMLAALTLQLGADYYSLPVSFLGALISVVYIGFVVGNLVFRYLLTEVSYIRGFAVCAAILAVLTLLLPLFPSKTGWIILRFSHGLFFSTTMVLCEGWLNSVASKNNRSKINAIFLTFNFLALGLGQYVLLLGEELVSVSFSLASMVIIASLIPMCMTRLPEPQTSFKDQGQDFHPLTIKEAYYIAPIAFVGQFIVGVISGATFLFVRYAEEVSQTDIQASNLAAVFFGSGFLLQIPVGWISDKVSDRRSVMIVIYILTTTLGVVLFFGQHFSSDILLMITLLFGAISATTFPLNIAYGQSFANPEKAAEYSGRLFQSYALGAVLGPAFAGFLMDYLSAAWLFLFIAFASVHMIVFLVTPKIMHHYIPAKVDPFQILSTHSPSMAHITPDYTEHHVGPLPVGEGIDAEDATIETSTYTEHHVGPLPAEDSLKAEDSMVEAPAYTEHHIGPLPAEDSLKAEDSMVEAPAYTEHHIGPLPSFNEKQEKTSTETAHGPLAPQAKSLVSKKTL